MPVALPSVDPMFSSQLSVIGLEPTPLDSMLATKAPDRVVVAVPDRPKVAPVGAAVSVVVLASSWVTKGATWLPASEFVQSAS